MTTDGLLTEQDQEELLSKVYVLAVATRAGYVTAERERDRDGIDLQIQAGGTMYPALDIQLKATINMRDTADDHISFPLLSKNYNRLCRKTQTPRLLVVLDLSRDKEQWMTITADELAIRYCAYWLNLRGYDQTSNQVSKTVYIPKRNRFDVAGLQLLMEQSRTGRIQ